MDFLILVDFIAAVSDVVTAIMKRSEERVTTRDAYARRREARSKGRTGFWGLDDWDDE